VKGLLRRVWVSCQPPSEELEPDSMVLISARLFETFVGLEAQHHNQKARIDWGRPLPADPPDVPRAWPTTYEPAVTWVPQPND
jgi:hypothetical protein